MDDQKNRHVFSWWPEVVQDRDRSEFPISAGIGLVTRSAIKYFSNLS